MASIKFPIPTAEQVAEFGRRGFNAQRAMDEIIGRAGDCHPPNLVHLGRYGVKRGCSGAAAPVLHPEKLTSAERESISALSCLALRALGHRNALCEACDFLFRWLAGGSLK